MAFELSTASLTDVTADWLIVPAFEDTPWSPGAQALNELLGDQLSRLKEHGDFDGKLASLLPLRGVVGPKASRVMLVGLGRAAVLDTGTLEKAIITAIRALSDKPNLHVCWVPPAEAELPLARFLTAAAIAAHVGSVGQDLFRTERGRYPLASVRVLAEANEAYAAAIAQGDIIGTAINLARDLVNRPAQEITPSGFAKRAQQAAQEAGLICEVWDQPRLTSERMQSLLAVARGSAEPPRLVAVEHRGGGPNAPTLCLVGKGVTFDSGGLSLKPNDGMLTMKCDMAGAATVLGAMTAIGKLKLPVNVLGLMGLVENMPGGAAFKLGDILTARNGVTIEVLNTDAEGRLVLADVLSYAVDRKVDRIIDLATLTGACVVALGEDVAGAFSNHDAWRDQVLQAGRDQGEPVWPLPMYESYNELIKGDVGDLKNTGGRWGGAITAAKFLERFVAGTPWVHLDIAGPAFASSNKPHREAGATGCFVRTLVEVARRHGAMASAATVEPSTSDPKQP